MFLITNTWGATLGSTETIDEAWEILAKEVEEANAKNIPFEWNIYDTEKGRYLL